MPDTFTPERFARDVADHQLTVLHDDGLYRHLLFRKPESNVLWFELVTWPGSLTIHGDMGTYTFHRDQDMMDFFTGRVNPDYWSQKLDRREGYQQFSPTLLREAVLSYLEDEFGDDGGPSAVLLSEVESMVLHAESEQDAHEALESFVFDGFRFVDSWEWDLNAPTYHFLWCCHAINYGVEAYWATKRAPDPVGASR